MLHLEVCTVPSLPGGWMSQVLRALYGCGQVNWADYLTAQQLSDLAYFRPELGDCPCAPVPLVRIAEAFMDLICALCAGDSIQKLEIQSVNGAPLDDLSRDVAAVLQMKCGLSLVLL